jgi:hypothetical protein
MSAIGSPAAASRQIQNFHVERTVISPPSAACTRQPEARGVVFHPCAFDPIPPSVDAQRRFASDVGPGGDAELL